MGGIFTASKRGQLANKGEGNSEYTSYLKEDIERHLKKYSIKN